MKTSNHIIATKTFVPDVKHPSGICLNIVGMARGDCGKNCKHHTIFGEVLNNDTTVHLHHVQIVYKHAMTKKMIKQSVYEAIWVSDGIDRCRVGFLPKAYLAQGKLYDGVLCQVVGVGYDTDKSLVIQSKFHRNCGLSRPWLYPRSTLLLMFCLVQRGRRRHLMG
jgi:hypothetical protein